MWSTRVAVFIITDYATEIGRADDCNYDFIPSVPLVQICTDR